MHSDNFIEFLKLINYEIYGTLKVEVIEMMTQIRHNYQLTLPAELRKQLGLKIGDLLEIAVKGYKLILTPKRPVDLDQAWFWTREWQEAEREVDEDIKAGRVKKAKSVEELIRTLKKK